MTILYIIIKCKHITTNICFHKKNYAFVELNSDYELFNELVLLLITTINSKIKYLKFMNDKALYFFL